MKTLRGILLHVYQNSAICMFVYSMPYPRNHMIAYPCPFVGLDLSVKAILVPFFPVFLSSTVFFLRTLIISKNCFFKASCCQSTKVFIITYLPHRKTFVCFHILLIKLLPGGDLPFPVLLRLLPMRILPFTTIELLFAFGYPVSDIFN